MLFSWGIFSLTRAQYKAHARRVQEKATTPIKDGGGWEEGYYLGKP